MLIGRRSALDVDDEAATTTPAPEEAPEADEDMDDTSSPPEEIAETTPPSDTIFSCSPVVDVWLARGGLVGVEPTGKNIYRIE
jgi:hypothetical protein